MVRGGVTVLYAHWEGFVKAAAVCYLEYVARQHLVYRELTVPFRALAAKAKLDAAAQSNKPQIFIAATKFILNQQDERSSIPWQNAINTRSNLNSSVLKEIVVLLGLDYSPYVTKEKLIDQTLLRFRNNIAHGKGLSLTHEQFEELYREIVTLMDIFRAQVENATVMQAFRVRQGVVRSHSPSSISVARIDF